MGYMHIENLYRPEAQRILAFREVYALEKVHGTSAHVGWGPEGIRFFAGGAKHEAFVALFDTAALMDKFAQAFPVAKATVYGEAYGGKMQGMKATYGESLRFIAFDVQVGDLWLSVPDAEKVVLSLGLEFVPYEFGPTDLLWLGAERDRPSVVAERRGCGTDRPREGVVLRPPFEVRTNNGGRLIAKHKGDAFAETKTPREVDPALLKVLEEAEAIAAEWVTEMRLTHVLDRLGNPTELSATGAVIKAMVEDVTREASGEIVDSKDARKAIGTRAARMFKARITTIQGGA